MLRKWICVILIISLLMTVSSCHLSEKEHQIIWEDRYIEGQDFIPTAFSWSDGPDNVAVTDKGIYFKVGDFLFFADFGTMKARVLCFKPACLHMMAGEWKVANCNAFCRTVIGQGFVGAYGNYIYFNAFNTETQKYELVCAKEDGSGRNTIISDIGSIVCSSMRIHRGTLYYAERESTLDGEAVAALKALSLTGKKEKPEVLLNGSSVPGSFSDVLPYGNYIYYNEKWVVGEEHAKTRITSYSRYNILDGSQELLVEDDDIDLYGIIDHKLLFYDEFMGGKEDYSGADLHYYELDPDTKDRKVSELGVEKFQEAHPEWRCDALAVTDEIAFVNATNIDCLTTQDYSDGVYRRVVDSEGREITSFDTPNVILIEYASQVINIKGEAYYLDFAASVHDFAVKLYKVSELLAGKTDPIVLLKETDLNDLYATLAY